MATVSELKTCSKINSLWKDMKVFPFNVLFYFEEQSLDYEIGENAKTKNHFFFTKNTTLL